MPMYGIGKRNFNYRSGCRSIGAYRSMMAGHKNETHMKNDKVILAVIPGVVIALAALALSFRSPVGLDVLIGYGSVLALLGVAALEYRINWKRVFGR